MLQSTFRNILFLILLNPAVLRPAVSPEVADFIDKVNRYYYSYAREGMHGMDCDITVSAQTTPSGPNNSEISILVQFPEHYHFDDMSKPILSPISEGSGSSQKTQAAVGNLCGTILDIWADLVRGQLVNPDNKDYTVSRNLDGFQIESIFGKLKVEMDLDHHDILKELKSSEPGGAGGDLFPSYEMSSKGPVLAGFSMAGGGMRSNCVINSSWIDGYLVPNSMAIDCQPPKGHIKLNLAFSNYRFTGTAHDLIGDRLDFGPETKERLFFWRVRSHRATVYLLGSIHFGADRRLALPAVVGKAFDQANYVGFETDLGELDRSRRSIVRFNQAEAQSHQAESKVRMSYAQADAIRGKLRQYNIDPAKANSLAAGQLTFLLTEMIFRKAGFYREYGVDYYFYYRALARKKPVFGLEYWWKTSQAIADIPGEKQGDAILQAVEQDESMVNRFPQIFKAWEDGEDEYFAAERRFLENDESGVIENHILIDQRNEAWIPQLQRLLGGTSTYFVVVGSAHMVGPESVPMLLKAKGYDVQRIDASQIESDKAL